MITLPDPAKDLLERQLGVVSRPQLIEWLSPKQVDGYVRRGSLLRLARGVYRVAGGAQIPAQDGIAAALRSGPTAVITGPFVLGYLRVDGFDTDAPFEVLVPPGRTLTGVDFAVRAAGPRSRSLIKLGDVRLTGPLDALIDSGRFRQQIGDRKLRLAYDWLRWHGHIQGERAAGRIQALAPSDRGADSLLTALGAVDDAGKLVLESEGERDLGQVLALFDPPPEPQVWVTPSRRVDFYFRSLRLGYEYLGSVDHQTVAGRLADAGRDQELSSRGIVMHYVRSQDLADRRALLGSIASAVTVRAHELGQQAPLLRARLKG